MDSPLRSLRNALAAAGAALLLGALGAPLVGCETEGYTPACDNNLSTNGILIHASTNPCANFGYCMIRDADKHVCTQDDINTGQCVENTNATVHSNVKDCCVDSKGQPLTGYDLDFCLYGFGAIDLGASTGAGASTGTGSGGTGGSTGTGT
jgi:hypothetical protein